MASFFDASAEERQELIEATFAARKAILARSDEPVPDGFNLGVNVGAASGQTVFHLHLHLIPRYGGDTPDPRGGVRHCIPGHGHYEAAMKQAPR